MELLFGKRNDDIETPEWLYKVLDEKYHFDFDPCPINYNPNQDQSGLKSEWGQRNFINPPFSQIKDWLVKGVEEAGKGKLCVFLITLRGNTNYWFDWVWPLASEIQFIQGKITFKGYDKPCPIPMVIVVYEPGKLGTLPIVFNKNKELIVAKLHRA